MKLRWILILPAVLVGFLSARAAEARCCTTSYQRYHVVHYYTYNPANYHYAILPPRWSVGVHLTGMSSNHAVGDEGLAMGGMGTHIRFRGYRFGGEMAVDVLGRSLAEGGISRVSVPIQLSGMLYLIPYGRFNLYLLGGIRFVPSHVRWDLPNLTADQNFTEFGAQAGVGGELLLTRYFALTADLRAFGTLRNNNDIAGRFYKDLEADQATPVPEKTAGLELSLGASFRF